MMPPFPHHEGEVLASHTTFGIGGKAKFFAKAKTKEEMKEMLLFCHKNNLNFFILGKGSNTLFDTRGFNGLVIQNGIDFLEQREEKFRVGSGYGFARLGGQTARLGWSGLEFASGIPATVGGAVFMNAGANGRETKDSLESVTFLNERGEEILFKREEIEFGYRQSSFQSLKGAIVEAVFALTRSENAKAAQKELLEYRLKTQPYKDKSAGCAFRNPPNEAAGRLIDQCGGKGIAIGDAAVSGMHANFIINKGFATSDEILQLIKTVKEKVYQEKGILLEEEIRYVPYE